MTADPRLPPLDECVLAYQIERWATETPDVTAFLFDGGERWTWTETLDLTRRAANALRDLGVRKGDHVLSWQPNTSDAVLTWFALNYLGAVYVPLNTALKGGMLERLIQLSDAEVIVCHADLVPRLADIDTAALRDIIVTGGDATLDGLTNHPASALRPAVGLDAMPDPVEPWNTQFIIFTSGTTGPSKAVLSSYLKSYSTGPVANRGKLDGTDRVLVSLPLFHVGGTSFVAAGLANGGSSYIDTHFKTKEFWSIVREQEITATALLAAMVPFLLNLPAFEGERDHALRRALVVPWNEEARAVVERYGIEAWTAYSMTEINVPLVSELSPGGFGSCGRPRAGVDVRVVDENDCEVAPGAVGELIVRADLPWSLSHGYYKNPEATAAAWRNGWFHTGDGFRCDQDGNFYFVDRIRDAIRRRGENISTFEVEAEVAMHPDVAEVAAIAVPSELGEDEVMVVVAARDAAVDPVELFEFLRPRMAHFMLPRFIRVVDELPMTPTHKVQKFVLKQEGITSDTWDRDAAGIEVRSERFRR